MNVSSAVVRPLLCEREKTSAVNKMTHLTGPLLESQGRLYE